MSYPASLDSFSTKTDGVTEVMAADVNLLQAAVVAIETELGTDPAGTLTDLKTRLLKSLSTAGNLQFAAPTALTISAGEVTVTQNYHTVDTEAAGASDDLETINGGADGLVLILRQANDARDVTIKHATGNIYTTSGSDYVLSSSKQALMLIYDNTLSVWIAFDAHAPLTVTDTSTIDFTLTGQALTASVIPGGIAHNDLASKQGGTAGEYYHLTDAQLAALHAALTVTDTATVDLTLTGQALQAAVIPGGIKLDDLGTPDDNTDLDASASRHGLLPKLSGGSGYYLNGAGAFDNTLKTRVDRLFGTDKPSHANFFTQRQFYNNDYANNIVGFETEANPYTFPTENCPFSWNAIPTGCTRYSWGSWLQMRVATSFPLTLRWSSSTKKNFLNAILCFSPSIKTSDYLAYEIRWWGVQTPTASDKYWSFRIMWKPSTSSQWPLYGKLYSGTGVTYAEGDGTARSGPIPIPMGTALSCQFGAWHTTSTPYGGFTIKSAEAIYGGNLGTVVSTWPNEAKCFDISITSGDYQTLHIDDIVLSDA